MVNIFLVIFKVNYGIFLYIRYKVEKEEKKWKEDCFV